MSVSVGLDWDPGSGMSDCIIDCILVSHFLTSCSVMSISDQKDGSIVSPKFIGRMTGIRKKIIDTQRCYSPSNLSILLADHEIE